MDPPRAVSEEARDCEHEEQLAELGGLELETAQLDPALRAARRVAEWEDEQHQEQSHRVDGLLCAAVSVGVDREDDEESHEAESGGNRLAHDVVVLVARRRRGV